MKFTFKSLIVLVYLTSGLKAQNKVGYSYDLNGNRNQRYFVGLKPEKEISNELDTLIHLPQDTISTENSLKKEREIAMNYGVNVYPNPTRDVITVSIFKAGVEQQRATVSLIDSNGKIVDTKEHFGAEINFDLSNKPPGNYYLNIIFENKERLGYSVIKIN